MEDSEFETCVLCNKTTDTPIDLHIDMRTEYIEGAGQLCKECYEENYTKNKI